LRDSLQQKLLKISQKQGSIGYYYMDLCESQSTFFLTTLLSVLISAFGLFLIIFAANCHAINDSIVYENACSLLGFKGGMEITMILLGCFMLLNLIVLFVLTFLPLFCKRQKFVE